MITIYHNPRCAKSREVLYEIENLNWSFKIRKYLDEPFSKNELKEVVKKLNIKPLEFWLEPKNLVGLKITEAKN